MPPIERSNMPLIISTIMPQARMPVCAVSSRTTAALAARGKVVGSRIVITRDQGDDQHDEQQLPVGGDADEQAAAARPLDAGLPIGSPGDRAPLSDGAAVAAHAALSLSRASGRGELEDGDLGGASRRRARRRPGPPT